jgi:hypothetical protein
MSNELGRRAPFARVNPTPFIVLAVFVLLAVGVLAYRILFTRPGEAAIQLIPQDALLVVTLDTTPSPQQVVTFKRISDAFKAEKLDAELDATLTSSFQNSPLAKEIRPYLGTSFAVAGLKKNATGQVAEADWVLLMAVKESETVKAILAKYGQKATQDGVEAYTLPKEHLSGAMVSGYLIVSDKPEPLAQIAAVAKGSTPSMAKLPEYQQARAALPADANLMVFASPQALSELQTQSKSVGGGALQNSRWMAFGASVREDGLETVFQMPSTATTGSGTDVLGQIAAIDPALMTRLPEGAYGMLLMSQPGKYWDGMAAAMKQDKDAGKSMEEGIVEFEKQTGMSVPRDILPNLSGHFALVVYPDAEDEASGVDGLIVLDDTHGAAPAALAAKIRDYVTRASGEGGKTSVRFVSTERSGATVWSLDSKTEGELRKSISQTVASPLPGVSSSGSGSTNPALTGAPYGGGPNAGTAPPPGVTAAPAADSEAAKYMGKKTLVYAEVGKTVLLASSQAMLDKAVRAYTGGQNTLAADPAFGRMQSKVVPGAQSVMLVNVGKILQTLQPYLAKNLRGSQMGVSPDDILRIFGGNKAVLVSSQRYDGKVMTGSFFMPLDIEQSLHVIGAAVAASKGTNPPPTTLPTGTAPTP